MKVIQNEKGFTLVELAIVMAIIGLLIGGILKGQELMENARVASTVSQIKSYEAAVTTFRDTFNAIPGDMPNPGTRLANCTGTCTPTVTGNTGDQIVGTADGVGSGNSINATTPLPADPGNETSLFWVHLLLADLIGGVTDSAVRDGTVTAWGETHPGAKIGGGFFVGHSDGNPDNNTAVPGRPGTLGTAPVGLVLILRNTVVAAINATPGIQPVSPLRAAQIDRKIDDGQSDTGTVQGYGLGTSCYFDTSGSGAGPYSYVESIKSKDCGLIIQIQG